MDPVAPPGPWPRSSTTKGAAVTPSQESSSLLGTQKQGATSAAAKTLLTAVTVEAKSDMKKAKNFLREGPMVLKGYCFLACAACMAVAITQMIGNIGDPFGFIVSVYAFVFAFVSRSFAFAAVPRPLIAAMGLLAASSSFAVAVVLIAFFVTASGTPFIVALVATVTLAIAPLAAVSGSLQFFLLAWPRSCPLPSFVLL